MKKTKTKKADLGFDFERKSLRLKDAFYQHLTIVLEENFNGVYDFSEQLDSETQSYAERYPFQNIKFDLLPVAFELAKEYDIKLELISLPAFCGLKKEVGVAVTYNSNVTPNWGNDWCTIQTAMCIHNSRLLRTRRLSEEHNLAYPKTTAAIVRQLQSRRGGFFNPKTDGEYWYAYFNEISPGSLSKLGFTSQHDGINEMIELNTRWPIPCANKDVGPNTQRIKLYIGDNLLGANASGIASSHHCQQDVIVTGRYNGNDLSDKEMLMLDIPGMRALHTVLCSTVCFISNYKRRTHERNYRQYMISNPDSLQKYIQEKNTAALMANATTLTSICNQIANTTESIDAFRVELQAMKASPESVWRSMLAAEKMAYDLKSFHSKLSRLNKKYAYSDSVLKDLLEKA